MCYVLGPIGVFIAVGVVAGTKHGHVKFNNFNNIQALESRKTMESYRFDKTEGSLF